MKTKSWSHHPGARDETALLGIALGTGLLLSACCLPQLGMLALPALLVLLPSLLLGMR